MALTKETITDKIESVRVQDYYIFQVREAIQVLEDSELTFTEFSSLYISPRCRYFTII